MSRSERGKEALGDAAERFADARETVAGKAADARDTFSERRDAAFEAVAERRDAALDAIAKVKPRLRGVLHEYAFFAFLVLGAVLVVLAPGPRATIAVAIYAASLAALFGVSALYHVPNWKRPSARRWMRRLDHTMIFLLIAGTFTPFALLVLDPPFATALLVAVWTGALAGTIVELVWLEAPKWVSTIVYCSVGLIGAVGFPAIVAETGLIAGVLIASGGALYVTGAVIYAVQKPNPNPAVFGYHEIFHVLVIAAAATHFAAVALYAVPAA